MSDKAGRWLRVSTGNQDEASQIPDVDKWCDARDYETSDDTTYLVHGKSAYHGEQDKALDKALADMRAGRINVLVVWAYDRIERRGAYNAFDLARRVKEAGGRIEYVRDSHLNTANDMSDVMLALAATVAHMESKRKSERIIIKHDALRKAGSLIGRAPYGFQIVKRDGIKTLAPLPAEASVIVDAATWYLDGMTLDQICEKLNANDRLPRKMRDGKQPLWWAKTLSGVLRNECVVGRRKNSKGITELKVEPILDRDVWERVVRRMDERSTRKGISQAATPALLTSVIRCGRCQRNMYKTGQGYYCRVKGCDTFIMLGKADLFVSQLMARDTHRDIVETVIAGHNHDEEIAEVKRDMSEAVQSEDFATLAELKTELDRLRSLPAEPTRIVRTLADVTVAEMWATMTSDAERRAYLMDRGARLTVEYRQDETARRLRFEAPWHEVAAAA